MNGLTPQERDALQNCPFLKGTEPPQLERIQADDGAVVGDYAPGEVVYAPRQFQRRLGILLSGQLQVTKGALSVSELEPGDLFGAAALYSDVEEFATTITARKDSRCLLLEQQLVDRLLAENGRIRENYLRYLTGRIRFLSGRMQSLAQPGAEGKLARYLLANGQSGQMTCSATELAHRLGIGRATLYRAFEALERSGLIVRKGKTILISDPAGLEGVL